MTLRLNGSSSGYTEIDAPAAAGSNTLTLPTGNGSANQFIKNGSTAGELEYSSVTEDSSGNITCTSRVDATQFRCTDDGTASLPSINPGLDNDTGLFRPASNSIGFSTTGSERMRIGSSGHILIHTTTNFPGAGNTNVGAHFEKASNGTTIFVSRGDSLAAYFNRNQDGELVRFQRSGNGVGNVSITATSTTYNTSSDYRLKENVVSISDGITRVKKLAPKRFNFIVDPDKTVDGFLAHEAQAVVPEAVTGTHNEVDDDGNAVMQGIDQSKLVPLLTAALQEAIAKIETLETKVAALEAGS